MFKKLNETITLKDSKGHDYVFDMYAYDTIDAIDEAVKNFERAGLYIFAKRYIENAKKYFILSYIGETGDYSTRDYRNHHKRICIEQHGCNEIGFHLLNVDEELKIDIANAIRNKSTDFSEDV